MDKKESCCEVGNSCHCGSECGGFLHKMMMILMIGVVAFLIWHGYRGAKRILNGSLRHQEYMRLNLAVDGCNKAAVRESVDSSGVKTQEPIREVFIKCMEDKGYLEYRDLGKISEPRETEKSGF